MSHVAIIRIAPADRAAWLARVCGMTVLARAITAAAREGIRDIVLEGGDDQALAAALETRPLAAAIHHQDAVGEPADGFRIAPDTPVLVIDKPYVLDRPILRQMLAQAGPPSSVLLVAGDPATRRAAKLALLEGTKKPADGIVAIVLARPVSRWISFFLSETAVTPNQVTYVATALGLAAGLFAALGGYGFNILAALCLFLGVVADCVDGELAKLRYQNSRFGEWIDSLSDDVATFAYLLGLSLAAGGVLRGIGLAAACLFVLSSIYTYYVLARWVGTIDTARFPYFFVSRGKKSDATPGALARVVGYAFRRDFFIALFFVLAVLGTSWLSLLLLSLGVTLTAFAVFLTALLRPPGAGTRP